jgi:hypothetical protein
MNKGLLGTELKEMPGYLEAGKIVYSDGKGDADEVETGEEWEIDCYSRPVIGDDGKKLWEVLITDSAGTFRYIKPMPSNTVNSRNLRLLIEEVIEEAPVKPRLVRFFRNQMYNMINIALSKIDVEVKASRCTTQLCMWLEEREKNIYPNMKGYNPQLKQQTILDYDVSQPDRLPDVFKSESYAFVALPSEVFINGDVNLENIKKGKLAPLNQLPPASEDPANPNWIHGITLFSKRADAVAAWMNGLEIAFLRADLIGRELILNTDIRSQFIIVPLNDAQKREAQIFEKGKAKADGYHFISVQFTPESEEVEGFWLLRQFSDSL